MSNNHENNDNNENIWEKFKKKAKKVKEVIEEKIDEAKDKAKEKKEDVEDTIDKLKKKLPDIGIEQLEKLKKAIDKVKKSIKVGGFTETLDNILDNLVDNMKGTANPRIRKDEAEALLLYLDIIFLPAMEAAIQEWLANEIMRIWNEALCSILRKMAIEDVKLM